MKKKKNQQQDDDDDNDDDDDAALVGLPDILIEVLHDMVKSNPDELIPLAFMNVVMPTAMSTMHETEELQQSSALTAERGLSVLEALAGEHHLVEDNARAILAAAATATDQGKDDDNSSSSLIQYWKKFFDKWGYKEIQKNDISKSMKIFIRDKY